MGVLSKAVAKIENEGFRFCFRPVSEPPSLLRLRSQASPHRGKEKMADEGRELSQIPRSLPSSSSLNDPQWIISFRQEMGEALEYEMSANWKTQTIYRVPKIPYDLDEATYTYTPQIVSIGPYHHGNPKLEEMNVHKWRALSHILKRNGQDVGIYVDAVRNLKDQARRCYEASLHISSDDFVENLVLDSIFFLEILNGVALNKFPDDYSLRDPVFSISSNMHSLQSDFILLENQLPLFVLNLIASLQFPDHRPNLAARLAFHFFQPIETFASSFFGRITITKEQIFFHDSLPFFDEKDEALHCLDVFRRSLGFPNQNAPSHLQPNRQSPSKLQLISCVDELRNADIQFGQRKTDKFWDIKFKDGVLKIPRICIKRNTKSIFLNLIAFELCHLECTNHITSYVIFMDCLINSEVDVKYLRHKGIIKHWLGNDREVADMFNRLTSKVTFDVNSCYLSELYQQVDIYYNLRWNTWRASFIHKYFSNPWTIISLVAAVVLLLLTFAKTFYSIYAYYKPRS